MALKNRRILLLNLLLLFTSLALSLLGIELFCYFYLKIPAHMPPLVYFEPSENPAKRLMKNADVTAVGAYREFRYRITTDDNGFRRTYPFKNTEGTYSVAVLGDSQSFGVGVEDDETLASLLAKNLEAPVLNAACPGYNTIEEFWIYKNRVQQFKPRHVLLLLYVGNDPYETYKNRELYDGSPENQPWVQEHKSFSPSLFLADLKDFLSKRSAIYTSLIKLRQYPSVNRFLYRYRLVNTMPPSELAIFKREQNREALAHWQITEQVILHLREEVESNGFKFWIVLMPDRYQVDPAYWQQWVSKYNLNPQEFDLRLPNRHLAEFAKREGIHFVDPTERLAQMQQQGRNVYWRIDAHLNGLGHKVIADFVASHLAEHEKLTPGKNR